MLIAKCGKCGRTKRFKNLGDLEKKGWRIHLALLPLLSVCRWHPYEVPPCDDFRCPACARKETKGETTPKEEMRK